MAKQKKTEMTMVSIDKLVPYVNNARTHSPEQVNKLRSSIREFGFINPIIIDADFGVIAGHGRLLAAREEGISEVPCVLVDYLTEAQKKAYILADNRFALDAGWDEDLLRIEIEALQAEDFDVMLTGFDAAEIDELFAVPEDDIKDDEFDVDEELEKPAVSKQGDVWLLGNHRLVVGDSTKPETYEKLMDGKKANLTVTDPPYNVNYEGTAGKIKNDNLENDKFYQFLLDAFNCVSQAMADHPTMKPVPLIAYPILNSSLSNCIVCDPFGGSGSTLIACEQTNRICYTIELDEKYADVIIKRYIEQVGNSNSVFVERDGKQLPYCEVAVDE